MCWTVERRSCGGEDSKLAERTLEFIVHFPDLIERWVIRNKMMLKASMRHQLEQMRQALECSRECGSDRIDAVEVLCVLEHT